MRALFVSALALAASTAPAFAEAPPPGCKVTLENFARVKIPYARPHVYTAMGCQGTVFVESMTGNVKTTIEQWQGEKLGSIVHITFQRGQAISKSQAGF
nr:hypothetical protein [Methylobacterium sp. L1A1]